MGRRKDTPTLPLESLLFPRGLDTCSHLRRQHYSNFYEVSSPTSKKQGHTVTSGATGGETMAGNLSKLELAIQMLVDTYDKYAGKDLLGRRRSAIRKKDFQKLLGQELNHMLTDTENKQAATRLIRDLDKDSDGKISFEEYWNLLGEIVGALLECRIEKEK